MNQIIHTTKSAATKESVEDRFFAEKQGSVIHLMELHSEALEELEKHEYKALLYSRTSIKLSKIMWHKRSYEDLKCYFIVFCPFNKTYKKDPDWYKYKALNAVRQNIKSKHFYYTREIYATKIHINGIVYSEKDLVQLLHDKNRCNKFRAQCFLLKGKADRERVLNYITKESKLRSFKKYEDYNFNL